MQFFDIRNVAPLHLADVVEQRAHGRHHGAGRKKRIGKSLSELSRHALLCRFIVKARRLSVRQHGADAVGHKIGQHGAVGLRQIGDDLARQVGAEFALGARQHGIARDLGGIDLCGGNVGKTKSPGVAGEAQRGHVVVLLFRQHTGFEQGARRDHADDIALDKPLGGGRVLHLLADGHFVALFDQPADIGIGAVERHAAHGGALGLAAVTARQRQFEFARRGDGVVKEHLVKVA